MVVLPNKTVQTDSIGNKSMNTCGRKRFWILPLLILLLSSFGSAESCENTILIEETGVTRNQMTFTISPPDGYYYPNNGLWATSIPRQAENIAVKDGDGDDLDQEIGGKQPPQYAGAVLERRTRI